MDTRQKLDDIRREIEDFQRELTCIAADLRDMKNSGELLEVFGEYPADHIKVNVLGNLNKARDALHEFWVELL